MRLLVLTISLVSILCSSATAATTINIDTKSDSFFENVVSDAFLLLDSGLRKHLTEDKDYIIEHARFNPESHGWQVRQNPKARLTSIYHDIKPENMKDSFASLIKPVVEAACAPQQYDPMNSVTGKCVREMLRYPISNPIRINYSFSQEKTVEQFAKDLNGLVSNNRYQQIVRTTADILNSAWSKSSGKPVEKSLVIVKKPLVNMVAGEGLRTGSRCGR